MLQARIACLLGLARPTEKGRANAPLVSVRLLAFLFVFAEELGRSFLPVYAGEFAVATPGLDPTFATGVVVGLHMSVVAIAMPFATIFYTRLGRARLYAVGALIASAGLIGTGLAGTYWWLLAFRALSGIGYATTYVACQGFVIESTQSTNRASGTAMMVGGITLADICGPAFGGVLAERFGQGQTYVFAAVVAGLAAMIVTRLMAGTRRPIGETPRGIKLRDFAIAFTNRKLVVQLVFAAIPAKMLLTGFLYYLLPVTLIGIGWREADVGRIVMIYGVVMLVGGPLFGHLTDRWQNHAAVVAIGALLAAGPLLAIPLLPDEMMLAASIVAVLALGCGQSMSISAQASMVMGMASETDVRQGHAPELTVLRFVERFGGGFGPMVAAPTGGAVRYRHGDSRAGRLRGGERPCLRRTDGRWADQNHRGRAMNRRDVLAGLCGGSVLLRGMPVFAGQGSARPYRIMMVLWRGETPVETGFRQELASPRRYRRHRGTRSCPRSRQVARRCRRRAANPARSHLHLGNRHYAGAGGALGCGRSIPPYP